MHLMQRHSYCLLLRIFYRRRSDGPFLLHACVFALLVAVAQVTPPLLEKRILLASVDRKKKNDIYPPVDRIQNHLIRGYQERHLGAAAAGLFLLHTYVSRLFARLSPAQVALLSRNVSHAYVHAASTLTGHCCE